MLFETLECLIFLPEVFCRYRMQLLLYTSITFNLYTNYCLLKLFKNIVFLNSKHLTFF